MTSLPSLEEIAASTSNGDRSALDTTLSLLFESSPILHSQLVPQVSTLLQSNPPATYASLIDVSITTIVKWPSDLQAQFIAGHPRIGEVKNLSHLSAKEQAAAATPPEILARLAHLNACYERRYPGLIYITFVNGRSRGVIMEELEGVLGLPKSLSADEPHVEEIAVIEAGSKEWEEELHRAAEDVGKIAKSRLASLGVQ